MPFCRKCGRRLAPYSEICPDCKTSTTGPLINIKKASTTKSFKIDPPPKITKANVPSRDITISVKVLDLNKQPKVVAPAKAVLKANSNISSICTKPTAPAEVFPPHQIKQTNISLKKDIITNPHDYEMQTFSFDLQCSNDHFWQARKALPISNGKACCPKCGEPLRKPKQKRRSQNRLFHR